MGEEDLIYQQERKIPRGEIKLTKKRRLIYELLATRRDHPSAEEIFILAKSKIPEISLATVYNCLEALVRGGLIKQVVHEKGATRYCSNLYKHHHFYCTKCGKVYDIEGSDQVCHLCVKVPTGFEISEFDIVLRGICNQCNKSNGSG